MSEKKSWRIVAFVKEADEEQAQELLASIRNVVRSSNLTPGGYTLKPAENNSFGPPPRTPEEIRSVQDDDVPDDRRQHEG